MAMSEWYKWVYGAAWMQRHEKVGSHFINEFALVEGHRDTENRTWIIIITKGKPWDTNSNPDRKLWEASGNDPLTLHCILLELRKKYGAIQDVSSTDGGVRGAGAEA